MKSDTDGAKAAVKSDADRAVEDDGDKAAVKSISNTDGAEAAVKSDTDGAIQEEERTPHCSIMW